MKAGSLLNKIKEKIRNITTAFHSYSALKITLILFAVNALLRLPAVYQDQPPFNFCDESIITSTAYTLATNGNLVLKDYLYGGMNFYLPALVARGLQLLGANYLESEGSFVLLSRFLFCIFLSSFAAVFVYFSALNFFKSKNISAIAAIMFTLSPMALGLSKIAYPDHYIVFFSAGFLFFCSCLHNENGSVSFFKKSTFWAGAFIGFALAVKYYSVIFVVPLFIFILKKYLGDKKSELQSSSLFKELFVAGSGVLLGFFIISPTLPFYFQQFISDMQSNVARYKGGQMGHQTDDAIIFYSKAVYLTAFGVLGFVLYLFGAFKSWKQDKVKTIVFILTPLLLILFLGRYRLAIIRNMAPLIPFVIIIQAVGFYYLLNLPLLKKFKYSYLFLIFLFFTEPVFKSMYSFVHDFFPDARRAAHSWTAKNIPKTSPTGVAYACWGMPVGGGNLRLQTMPTRLQEGECLDYYVMDEWFYETFGKGNMLTELIYNNLMFNNPSGFDYGVDRKVQEDFLKDYDLIKEFDRGYYGPAVWIYKAKKSCPIDHVQPPKRAFGWFGHLYLDK